jgi:uncharacterized membrane protein YbhN (UPF0104 family)
VRRRVWLGLRLVLPVCAFAYLFSIVPARELGASLAQVSLVAVGVALCTCTGGILLAAIRWRALFFACGTPDPPPLSSLFRLHMIGLFYNTYLPGAVGGDLVRALATRRNLGARGLGGALALVLLERALGLSGLLVLLALSFACFPLAGVPNVMLWSALGLVAAFTAVVGITLGHRLARFLPTPLARLANSLPTIESLPRFTLALALSVATQFAAVVAGHVLIASVAGQVSWKDSLVVLPLIGAAQYFPLTVGGAGVREAAFVLFYGLVHVSKADALAASLLSAGVQYAVAAVGGLLHLTAPVVRAFDAEDGAQVLETRASSDGR